MKDGLYGGPYMINHYSARLILPDPLWIVADPTLGELSWSLRSEPLPHLAIGLGLVEELRAVNKTLSSFELGKVLRLELESFNYGYWHGRAPITYADITRSNFIEYGRLSQPTRLTK